MNITIKILPLFIWLTFISNVQIKNNNFYKSYEAKIIQMKNETSIKFIGKFINRSSESINIEYRTIILKKGVSGNSSTMQSGYLKVGKKDDVILSVSKLDFDIKNYYKINLKIFNNKKVIAQDSLICYGK